MRNNEALLLKTREIIAKVVEKNLAEGLLFSGGIDTSVIAFEASKHKPITAITVAFEKGIAEDLNYAKKMALFLGLNHEICFFDVEEMFKAVSDVIAILKVFDPMEVRNSIPVYMGLKLAKKKKINSVMTGDGLDELFLGYPWLFHLPEDELKKRMLKMWEDMQFSSIPLGKAIGLSIKTPFLEAEFMEFAKKIDITLKLNVKNGKKYGKWLIRKAYENLIPEEIIWRPKAPLEIGTGTTVLPKFFEGQIEDETFEEKRRKYLEDDEVKLHTKEQLFYYETFRKLHGKPSEVYGFIHGKQCPNCKAFLGKETNFCRVCGAYPI
ncbi:MAG: asparagine synthase-related protein [Nitrososphaerota archaeon]|nr:asparagine synthase-related protein [Nitrososphaerota archaeon]